MIEPGSENLLSGSLCSSMAPISALVVEMLILPVLSYTYMYREVARFFTL